MARVLFATVPIAGHIQPFLAIARALVERGHQLRWYTGRNYAGLVEQTGASFAPYERATEFDDQAMELAFPARARLHGLRQLKFDLLHVFGAAIPGQLLDLEQVARAFSPDVIIADPCMLGALLFKERHGTPLVVINVIASTVSSRDTAPFGLGIPPRRGALGLLRNRALSLLARQVVIRDLQTQWRRVRRAQGLPTQTFLTDAPLVADLFLQPTVAGFEYPRSDLPPNVHLIGALHGDPPRGSVDSAWLAQLDPQRPLVHVTQGTMSNATPTLIGPTIEALAREPVHVVVATGGRSRVQLGLAPLPANTHVLPFVSYPELLPRTSVMVTNGGYGGVQLALCHGVPLVVWGTSEDKPETAARVAWSGVGIRLAGRAPKPAAIRRAVREVLENPRYRKRARELAQQYARQDAVARAVELTESLLTRKAAR
ncbi:MAG: glycosyltransferase [Myxococcaceae bacterium]|nr:glycosyltransferase [Myxococcaceae bacterium]